MAEALTAKKAKAPPKVKAAPVARAAGPDAEVRSLVTPEGVDLRLRLADVGQRLSALILDELLMGAIFIGLTIAGLLGLFAVHNKGGGEALLVLWLLAGFVLRNFYFIAFELSARAATPGKRRCGLRVAARNGGRLTADAIFTRNALRELELYIPLGVLFAPTDIAGGWMKLSATVWCGVFALLPLFNKDRLRAGDILAGTWVVKVPDRRLLRDLAQGGVYETSAIRFTLAQLDAYGIKELQVLEDVLRRFDRKAVQVVADRIRQKIGYARGEESDGAFLSAYYAALRQRLEARALLGRRRLDKHDKG
ncbi:MAG TPA: RDD family protein [Caulobacteraceae bacterium]